MAELELNSSSPDLFCVLLCIERKMMILLLLLMIAAPIYQMLAECPALCWVLSCLILQIILGGEFMPISQVRKLIHIYVYIYVFV